MSQARRRTFKVCANGKPNERFGIVVGNATVDAVLEKACDKLKISRRGASIRTKDNTTVDDNEYLLSDDLRPPNNVLVVVPRGETRETTSDLLTLMDQLVVRIQDQHEANPDAVIRELKKHSEESAAKNVLTSGLRETLESTAHLETRLEDPMWFAGIKSRFKTKNKFMRDRARSRISGYLSVTKDFVKTCEDEELRAILDDVVKALIDELREVNYHEGYFDRSDGQYRLCDRHGYFKCAGVYNEDACQYQSVINPYAGLNQRITFSSWNLDHIIEKSRSVLPSLLDAVHRVRDSRGKLEVNWVYFFDCLFTTRNLKLVETACHDKTEHTDRQCDPNRIVRKR